MRASRHLFLLPVLLAAVTSSQGSQPSGRYVIPTATYTIKANIDPSDSRVNSDVEINYFNRTKDTLTEIYMQLGGSSPTTTFLLGPTDSPDMEGRSYCRIDSILYLGVPIHDSLMSFNGPVLRIRLPQPMPPKRKGFFLMAVESKLADSEPPCNDYRLYRDWYPQVCAYRDGVWHTTSPDLQYYPSSQPARFNVGLVVDSSFDIAYPGRLLNERQHFGFTPKPSDDSILVDFHGVDLKGKRYYPVFEGGRKVYAVTLDNASEFTFGVGDDFGHDRAYIEDVTIDVFYRGEIQGQWRKYVAEQAGRIIRIVANWFGKCPHEKLTIASGHPMVMFGSHGPMIVSDGDFKDTKTLTAALAKEIAAVWFKPELDNSGDGPTGVYADGLAYYTAAMALYELHGGEGWVVLERLEKDQMKDPSTAVLQSWRRWKQVAAALWTLRFCVGDEQLQRGLRQYVEKFKYDLPTKTDFEVTMSEHLGADYVWLLTAAANDTLRTDPKLGAVEIEKSDDGVAVRYEVSWNGSRALPLEIAFVTNGTDTTYDTLSFPDGTVAGATVKFEKWFDSRPEAVIVDPNHYLIDVNRQNNYHIEPTGEFKYGVPSDLFPGLRGF